MYFKYSMVAVLLETVVMRSFPSKGGDGGFCFPGVDLGKVNFHVRVVKGCAWVMIAETSFLCV